MEYKIGLHIHTTNSDGRKTPDEMAKIYKTAGFDAVAITDHWKYCPEGELEGLKIFSGCEYNIGAADTSDIVMHIVGVGMTSDPELKRDASPQEIIDGIKASGGTPVLAHPAWSLNSVEQIEALEGFGMLEIYNSVSVVHESTRPYSGYIVDLLANKGMIFPLTATDDAHYYDGSDETKSYIVVEAPSLEWHDIADAIESCNFYATQGPSLSVKREGDSISVDCSECVQICVKSNLSWAHGGVFHGEGLTHAEYKLRGTEKWIRVEIKDADGREAWSNIICI